MYRAVVPYSPALEAAGAVVGQGMEPVPGKSSGAARVSVFVRVRPLTPAELAKGFQPLEGLTLESSAPEDAGAAVVLAPGIGGFAGLLGQEANTAAVFERCLARQVGTVLGGGAVSLFCYGCKDQIFHPVALPGPTDGPNSHSLRNAVRTSAASHAIARLAPRQPCKNIYI